MGFSVKIKEDLMVASARHCCVCHRYKGLKLEIHHIIPQEQQGENTFENGIVLCFDCHSDAGHYNSKHPRGTKVSPNELRKHKKEWFQNVKENNVQIPKDIEIALTFEDNSTSQEFNPVFIEEITTYKNISSLKKVDYKKIIPEDPFISNKIKTFDDFVLFLNGDLFKDFIRDNKEKEINPQPVLFDFGMTNIYKYENLSTCILNLKIVNNSPEVIEDYKLYIKFNGIIKAETVDKRKDFIDDYRYSYNTHFKNELEAEFIPQNPILVQNDSINIDTICFKPETKNITVLLEWKILARNFTQSGQLELIIKPNIEKKEIKKYVDFPESFISKSIIKTKFKF